MRRLGWFFERHETKLLVAIVLVMFYVAVAVIAWKFRNPEVATDANALLHLWNALTWR